MKRILGGLSAGLALWITVAAVGPASAQPASYNYQGLDTQNPSINNILMVLTLKPNPSSPGGYDVQGTIQRAAGHPQTIAVTGTFSRFTRLLVAKATWTDQGLPGNGTVGGSISGGELGTGTIAVTTSIRVPLGTGPFSTLSRPLGFTLHNVTTSGGGTTGNGGGGSSANPGPRADAPKDFHGVAAFGYTNVDLQAHFAPTGTYTYSVTGQITVHALRPKDTTTVMKVSGTYDLRHISEAMTVAGAPQGNSPQLTCTIVGPKVLQAQLRGLPTLGITNLFFTCRAP